MCHSHDQWALQQDSFRLKLQLQLLFQLWQRSHMCHLCYFSQRHLVRQVIQLHRLYHH